jgi:hypothetical protein
MHAATTIPSTGEKRPNGYFSDCLLDFVTASFASAMYAEFCVEIFQIYFGPICRD